MSKVTTIDRKEPVVCENTLYRITVGLSEIRPPQAMPGDEDSILFVPTVYKIINKEHGVVEDEQSRLPQALYSLGLLEMQVQQEGWVIALHDYKIAQSAPALPAPTPDATVIN